MKVTRTVYQTLPDDVQPLAKHGYMLFSPGFSWRKWANTPDRFVDEFFDDRTTFKTYVEEFWDSRITDIVDGADYQTPDHVQVYDAHKFFSGRLYALLRELQPEIVVETGVHHGVSTAVILFALENNGSGELYSIDNTSTARAEHVGHDDHFDSDDPTVHPIEADSDMIRGHPSCAELSSTILPEEKDPGWILPEDLRERWDMRIGTPARKLPELLTELDGIDAFLHDSEHSTTGMIREFDLAWEWLRPGGVVLSHHIGWNDAFETFTEDRSADHGLISYTYFGKYDQPGCSGYAVKR